MLESRQWRGVWWDPAQPEETRAGILTFSQADTELELFGLLPALDGAGSPLEQLFGSLPERPQIHGLTTDGKEITLDRCIPRGRTIGSGIPVERHHPGVIFAGHHFTGDVLLDAIEVRFTHIDDWT